MLSFATLSRTAVNVKSGPPSGEDLRMPGQLTAGAADVHHEHTLGVFRVGAADAVDQQPVLQVGRAEAGPAGGQPGELATVVLGAVPHPRDDLPRLTGYRGRVTGPVERAVGAQERGD